MKKRHKYRAKPGWYDVDLQPCSRNDEGNYIIDPVTKKPRGSQYYLHSQLELKTARNLHLQKLSGNIQDWARNTETWDFNVCRKTPFRQNSTYTPDFWVKKNDDSTFYIECKGYNYPGSLVKIKRAVKYYPQKTLFVYTQTQQMSAKEYLCVWAA